ncbi:MAG: hypothetical protein AAB957_00915 [Patescibacteria group bacterium]
MDQTIQYMTLMSEIIAKQSIILGPDIAILKARNVSELIMDDKGKVIEIKGESAIALQKLINEYVELSGMIVKNALGSIFEKYPDIKKDHITALNFK